MKKIDCIIINREGSTIEIQGATERQIKRLVDKYIVPPKKDIGFKKDEKA